MGFLLLGLDSFIACLAVGSLISKKAWVPFAALFGICDATAFVIGHALNWEMSEEAADVVATASLVVLGAYLLVVALMAKRVANTKYVWALPFLLTLDNISYGLLDDAWSSSVGVQFAQQLVSSALMAFVGVLLSVAIVRAVPQVSKSRVATAGVAGGAMIVAAPVLLALG